MARTKREYCKNCKKYHIYIMNKVFVPACHEEEYEKEEHYTTKLSWRKKDNLEMLEHNFKILNCLIKKSEKEIKIEKQREKREERHRRTIRNSELIPIYVNPSIIEVGYLDRLIIQRNSLKLELTKIKKNKWGW